MQALQAVSTVDGTCTCKYRFTVVANFELNQQFRRSNSEVVRVEKRRPNSTAAFDEKFLCRFYPRLDQTEPRSIIYSRICPLFVLQLLLKKPYPAAALLLGYLSST